MMKKILFLLIILASFGHEGIKAQSCTPDNQYTLPGIYPDTLVGLPCAHTTVLYQTTITVITPTDSLFDLGRLGCGYEIFLPRPVGVRG